MEEAGTWETEALRVVDSATRKQLIEYDNERKAQGIKLNTRKSFWRAIILISARAKKPIGKLSKQELIAVFNALLSEKKTNYGKLYALRDALIEKRTLSTREIMALFETGKGQPLSDVHAKNLMKSLAEKYSWVKLVRGSNVGHTESRIELSGKPEKDLNTPIQQYARISVETYFSQLQKFLIWLNNNEMPESISWFKKPRKHDNGIQNKHLWTEEEVNSAIEKEPSARGKCIWQVLYESAARNQEFVDLCINSITKNGQTYILSLKGKTGAREVPVVASIPYLNSWLSFHPNKDDVSSPLF
ncbi:MAG: hypothetical protein V1676_04475, partial [Candidatus Diapherotrites archaeon]